MIVGIDLGGTHTRVAVASQDGQIVASARTQTRMYKNPQDLVRWIAATAKAQSCGQSLHSIGVAAPGPLDARRGVLVNPPNLPGWQNVPLTLLLSTALGCPAHLENDAKLAGLGEFHHGAGKGTRHMAYVTWSTGIGSGLIMNGQLYVGAHGTAGEIGHTVLDPNGPIDSCGQRGCLEVFSGGRALEAQTGRSAADLFEAATRGEPTAREVVDRATRYMGYALVNLINLIDPDVIVLGGGMTGAWHQVKPLLDEVIHGSPFIKQERRPQLRQSELGDLAGQVGAIQWAKANQDAPADSIPRGVL